MDIEDLHRKLCFPPRAFLPVLPEAQIRFCCEDFVVEEIPTYLPDGSGEHLFLWVEKRDVAAGTLLTRLARSLNLSDRDIGVAGQKDRRAVTRQFISVPRKCEGQLSQVDDADIKILSVSAHGNKLRTGHLRGNRFRIVLRPSNDNSFAADDAAAVHARMTLLAESGFPNYFGSQRFGYNGNTIRDGLAMFRPVPGESRGKRKGNRRASRFAASAIQSAVFNLVLAQRVSEQSWSTPGSGDVVCRRNGIRPFLFDERGETPESELVPMGPMPGPKMMKSAGIIADLETAALSTLQLSLEDFSASSKQTPGTRRKFPEHPENCSAELTADGGIATCFELSSGAFATVVLADICGTLSERS